MVSARRVRTCSDRASAYQPSKTPKAIGTGVRGATTYPLVPNGRRRWMRGSASKTKATYPFGVYVSAGGCPTLSHMSGASGTAKVCANWAFVSGVPPVSPYLKLIERIQRQKGGYGRRGINWPQGPCAE